jgi:hypothetical protein
MAFFDNFTNPMDNEANALAAQVNPSSGGFFDSLPNIFMTPDFSQTGILTDEQQKGLRNQATKAGLLGTALTYFATPKTGNYGSIVPYLAKAGLGGMGAAQDVYGSGLTNLYRQQLLANRGDKKEAPYTGDFANVASNLYPNIDPLTLDDKQRKDVFNAVERLKKAGVEARLAAEMPLRTQESQYRYGTTEPTINPPKFATMQDVSDTAKSTGKTTDQVIKDLKSKGIQVRTQ